MYNSVPNQLYHLIHYGISFYLLFFLVPIIIFRQDKADRLGNFFTNFLKIIALIISIGYLLVILKLYEALALLALLSVFIYWRKNKSTTTSTPSTWVAYIFDFFDGHIRFQPSYLQSLIVNDIQPHILYRVLRRLRSSLAANWLLMIVLAISFYIRFTDALVSPAPAMSDGYVTLAWLKYVDERILFHDGIYPQGFYFFLSAIEKFSFINPLYIIKYTGPLDAMLIVLSIYFGVSRMLNDKFAGLVAALLFGVLGHSFMGDDWMRQGATNSQEFGFIFIMPSLYFLLAYLKEGKERDFWAGLAGVCIVGLVHPIAYALMLIGSGSIIISSLFKWKNNRRTFHILGMGILSGIITLFPVGIGFLYKIPFNSSGATYATTAVRRTVAFPTLEPLGWLSVIAIFVIFFMAFMQHRKNQNTVTWFSIGWLGLLTFLLYFAGGPLTHNMVLITRSLDLWGLVAPIVIAVAMHTLIVTYNEVTLSTKTSVPISLLVVAGSVVYSPPQPIIPYKMQWNSEVAQYLRISQQYHHQGYLLVAPTQNYALVLGTGYLLRLSLFLTMYNPSLPPLTLRGQHHIDHNISQDIFIYEEKQIYMVNKTNAVYPIEVPIYHENKINAAKLRLWIAIFKKHYPQSLGVYYQDQHLIIYHIHSEG